MLFRSGFTSTGHQQRVRRELVAAGFNRYALGKAESRYLPKLIHPEEHIYAATYGMAAEGSVMLIATDFRVIYLDCKPFFTNFEEIAYNAIAGVRVGRQGIGTTLVLHTNIRDYLLKWVNPHCANVFERYIAHRRIDPQLMFFKHAYDEREIKLGKIIHEAGGF